MVGLKKIVQGSPDCLLIPVKRPNFLTPVSSTKVHRQYFPLLGWHCQPLPNMGKTSFFSCNLAGSINFTWLGLVSRTSPAIDMTLPTSPRSKWHRQFLLQSIIELLGKLYTACDHSSNDFTNIFNNQGHGDITDFSCACDNLSPIYMGLPWHHHNYDAVLHSVWYEPHYRLL